MKIDWIYFVASLCVAAMLAWGGYALGQTQTQQICLCATVGITCTVASLFLFAFRYSDTRKGTMAKVAMGTYLSIDIVMNFIYSFFEFSVASFIIPNVLLLVLFTLIAVAVLRP